MIIAIIVVMDMSMFMVLFIATVHLVVAVVSMRASAATDSVKVFVILARELKRQTKRYSTDCLL